MANIKQIQPFGSTSYNISARYMYSPDTRSTAINPNDLNANENGIQFDFKQKSITGLNAAYSGIMSYRPYASGSDWTGGPAHQLAFDENGLHWRKSTDNTTWQAWEDIVRNSGTWGISITGNAATASRLNITSTDNAIARFDGTNGTIQNSGVTIDDNNNINTTGNIIISKQSSLGWDDSTLPSFQMVGADNKVFKFKYSVNGTNIDIGWDYTNGDGPGAAFRNSSSSNNPGAFIFYARKNTSGVKNFIGLPDGTLTWDGRRIVTSTNSTAVGNSTLPVYIDANGYTQTITSYSGNSATATKATQDSDGSQINTTYLKLSGGTMTGNINRYYSDNSTEPLITASTTNHDIYLWNFGHADSSGSSILNNACYKLFYKGTNSSPNNYLQLLCNIGGVDTIAVQFDENGNITCNKPVAASITGTANNITGILSISNGGTGKTTAREGFHALTAGLTEGTADCTDNTVFICGNTSEATNDYYYRKSYHMYNYIKNKAEGTWNISATKAGYIEGTNDAASPGGALLRSGAGRADASPSGDTWIYWDTLGGTSSYWGIRHNQAANTIGFYGAGTERVVISMGESKVTATTFAGNATTATKATQDSDGKQINTTYVKHREAGTSYTQLGYYYNGGETAKYIRVAYPSTNASWGMITFEFTIRQTYGSGYAGKLFVYGNWSSSANWNSFVAIASGRLTTSIKVYGSDKRILYIEGLTSWGGLTLDKVTVGDNLTGYDISAFTIDGVSELPSTYQTATMYYDLNTWNYTDYTVKKDGTGASGTWGINITGAANKLTTIGLTGDEASSTDTWRYVWFSYNDNATGRPAWKNTFAYQSSTGTLKITKIQTDNFTTSDGHIQSKHVSGTFTPTANTWYRIAETNLIDVRDAIGTFDIRNIDSGSPDSVKLEAGISWHDNPFIHQIYYCSWSSKKMSKARIVYKKNYGSQKAYLEIFFVPSRAWVYDITYQGYLWTLYDTPIATTEEYTENLNSKKEITFYNNAIIADNFKGNVDTATTLQTTRTIWGQSFNGSANITGNLMDVGENLRLVAGKDTYQFLTSTSGAANSKFGRIGLSDSYDSNIDLTNFRLDSHGPIRVYSTTTNNRLPMNAGLTGLPSYGAAQKYGTIIYSNGISMRDPYTGGGNDCGFIRHIETTSNSGELEIGVGDDGNELINVRQYNTSNNIVAELTLLNSSHNSEMRSILPKVNDTYTLGNSSNYWKEIYSNYYYGSLGDNKKTITVDGDANTYYPVRIVSPVSSYPYFLLSITRTYSETAPDTWNTATHRGGLSLGILWNGSRYWDGNSAGSECYVVRLNQTYSTMVGGIGNATGGLIVWLRGGGAKYHIFTPKGINADVTIYLETYTDSASRTFAPKTEPDTITVAWPGNLSGNAATASKLQTARTISLTGSVTGSGTFDGSGNLSISTTTNHTHSSNALTDIALTWSGSYSDGDYMLIHNGETGSNGGQLFRGINKTNTAAWVDGAHKWVRLAGDTMTGLLTLTSGATHKGVKIGNTYINAIDGNLILQNNTALRFGSDDWDWNKWAGLKYDSTNKIISLGLADNSIFTANSAQTGGIFQFINIDKVRLTDNTGGIYKYYGTASAAPFLQVNSNNLDVSVLKIDGNNPTDIRDSQSYGFNLKYMGTGSGAGNTLRLYGDNNDGTDQLAMEWSGDGKIGIGTTYNTNYRLNVNGIGYFNDGLRIIRNEASADASPDAIVYIENKNAADWAFKITKDTYNYGIKIDGTGSNLLNIGTNNVVTVHESTTSGSGSLRMNGTVYFANGTTYYINNNANANLSSGIFNNTTETSSASTGAVQIKGGLAVTKNIWAGHAIKTTDQTSFLAGSARRSQWYKITLPESGTSAEISPPSGSARWYMHSMTITVGGDYNSNPRGKIELVYYIYWNGSAFSLDKGFATAIGPNINKAKIYYSLTKPFDIYIDTGNPYSSIWVSCLQGLDSAASYDTAQTKVETASAITIANYTLVPTTYFGLASATSSSWTSWNNIIPSNNNTLNLGSSDYKWANIYATNFKGNADTASLLKPIASTTTASASTWNIPSGCKQVWGERFSDSTLTYTPEGGSATTITDTGDWTMWLAPNATTNAATLNMRIDGAFYASGGFNGNLSGTATKATQDGNGNTITSTYVKKAGDIMTGNLTMTTGKSVLRAGTSRSWINGRDTAIIRTTSYSGYDAIASMKTTNGAWEIGVYTSNNLWFTYTPDTQYNSNTNSGYTQTHISSDGKVWGAVWNDYAEMRNVPETQNKKSILKPGMCVREVGDDTMVLSTERMQPGCKVISDTFGFNIGETDNCKTPVAVSGRALVYIYEGREAARQHIGQPVCSGPDGTVSIMTDEEYAAKGYCCVGTISAIPEYETWGSGNVQVDGRIWIYVK